MSRTILKIHTDGTIEFIYSDALAPLLKLGKATTTRASAVEPCPGGWSADLSPVAPGVVLGPFPLRQQALDAEVAYIEQLMFAKDTTSLLDVTA